MNTFSRVAIALVGLVGTTGLVAAQPKVEPKAPKADDAKAADAKAAGPESKPPAELAEMAKKATGTWHCKGQGLDMHANKMADMNATMKLKLDVGGWWMHGTFESKMGNEPFTFEEFTTVDPQTRKLKRVMVESGGNWNSGESAGMKDGKIDWELTTHGSMGEGMFRDHEDLTDAKAGVKMWGEFSMDKGKTWTKVYEMACKK